MKHLVAMTSLGRNHGWRSRVAGLLALATVAAAIAIGSALPAKASVCTPFPSCFGAPFQVSGTPDNALWEWTAAPTPSGNPSPPGAATPIRTVPNGYTLYVGCQTNVGPQEDGEVNYHDGVYYASQTWDYAWDPALGKFVWVYDWWMTTPQQNFNYNWYSWPDDAHHCAL